MDGVTRVEFKYNGKYLLGFEVKVKPQGDVFMFVFERGHRRMHVSYHKDGRVNHNTDRPNGKHIPVMWDFQGEMKPMIRHKTPVKDIAERFSTWQEAVAAVIKQHGEPHKYSARTDGGINLYYRRLEDDPFNI